MTDDTKLCGAHATWARANCGLLKGHVQDETDWHESTVAMTSTEHDTAHTIEREITEVIRWAPHEFEIPRKPKAEPED